MSKQHTIPCPACTTPIVIDTYGLLQGAAFKCTNCDAAISLGEGGADIVKKAMGKFDTMKSQFQEAKDKHNLS